MKNNDLIWEYTTSLPIISKGDIIHEELINYLKNLHGEDIIILTNKKNGNILNDSRPEIKIDIKQDSNLEYNK